MFVLFAGLETKLNMQAPSEYTCNIIQKLQRQNIKMCFPRS